MKLLLLHGWGFDASLWDAMREELRGFETVVWDRGYFGPAACVIPDGPFVGVGHSLGSLLLALDPPPGCEGLIAINGFDRFTGPGRVPERIVARMQTQFAVRPEEILSDFRERVGGGLAPGVFDAERLSMDLQLLAEADATDSKFQHHPRESGKPGPRAVSRGTLGPRFRGDDEFGSSTRPLIPRLVLHGARDPLLPPEMRGSAFPGTAHFTHPDAGHLLPLTHPRWCAEQVREVLAWA